MVVIMCAGQQHAQQGAVKVNALAMATSVGIIVQFIYGNVSSLDYTSCKGVCMKDISFHM